MDKAARAVRRSSVKLLSLGAGHGDLNVLISEVKDMRTTAKAFMNAQSAASQDMLKWAANEENRALQDVANQLAELNLVWTEVQREFCVADRIRENEAVKLIRLKEGLLKVSEAYAEFSKKCSVIFEAQKINK
nr:hypothetical protein BaRGS_017252 [Batillaria attramentaria]